MKNQLIQIGIDCGSLSGMETVTTGTQRIAYELLRHLGRFDSSIHYTLYSYRSIKTHIMDMFGPQFSNTVLSPSIGYAQVRLPYQLHYRPMDLFVGLSQCIPKTRIPTIGFVYDLGYMHRTPQIRDKKLQSQTSYLCHNSKHICTISSSTHHDIITHYQRNAEDITVVPLGIAEIFKPIGTVYAHPYPYFLHVGGMRRDKNISIVIQALHRLHKRQGTRIDLILAGDTSDIDSDIHRMANQLKISDSILYIYTPNDEVLAALYRGAIATVIPSLWEGFGIPAIESMASGCPVIASNRGALRNVAECAYAIDPCDDSAWSEVMMKLVKDNAIRDVYNKNAGHIKKVYTWKKCAETVYQCIKMQIAQI